MLRLGFARILDVMRNLQILLEQSKLWKGELARRDSVFVFLAGNQPGPHNHGTLKDVWEGCKTLPTTSTRDPNLTE